MVKAASAKTRRTVTQQTANASVQTNAKRRTRRVRLRQLQTESGVPPQNPQPNTDTSPSAGTTPDMGTIPETPEEQAAQSLENYGNAVAGATPPANSGEAPGSPPTYDEVTGWDTSPPSPTDMNIDPGMPTTPMSCTSADCVYNETTGQYEQPPSPPPNYPTTEVPPHSSYSLPPEYQPLESETVLPGGITRGELYDTPMSEMSPEGEPAAPSESSTHEPTINPNGTFSEQPAPTPAAPASPSFFSDPLGAVSNWVGSQRLVLREEASSDFSPDPQPRDHNIC